MNWREWNTRSTVAAVLALVSVVTLVMPPISFFMSLIGLSFGSTAWLTSPPTSESRRVARVAMTVSGLAFATLIVGTWFYAALS